MTRYALPRVVAVVATFSLLLTACTKQAEGPGQAPPEKVVGVYTIAAQPLEVTTDLPGRTVAFRLAEVRPQVDGIIEKRLFKEGANVTVGDQLYQIDDARYQASYSRAKANLTNASSQLKRYRELVAKGSVSKQQFEDVEATWKLASAEVDLARLDLDYTRVMAPLTGRIGRSLVSEGALVSDGQDEPLALIQQIDPIYVDIVQPVSDLLRLQDAMASGEIESDDKDGAKVQLLLDTGRAYEHTGSLRFSEVSVDKSTGSVTLRAVVPNPDWRLLPGMFVRARLTQGRKDEALLVPQQAVQRDITGQAFVWLVTAENTLEQRTITIQDLYGNMWLVSDGLKAGDRVVTEGLFRLRGGIPVKPVEASNVNPVLDFSAQGNPG